MANGSDEHHVIEGGEVIDFDGAFISPESAVIPYADGSDSSIVRATRRVIDEATAAMGRDISWLPIDVGDPREAGGEFLPAPSVRTLKRFRLGLIGPIASDLAGRRRRERELQRHFGSTQFCHQFAPKKWLPRPHRVGRAIDLTVFRNGSGEIGAQSDSMSKGSRIHGHDHPRHSTPVVGQPTPPEPSPAREESTSGSATETLVDTAMEYALDRDRNSITIAHQDGSPGGSAGSFLRVAREYLSTAYADAVVNEGTFLSELEGRFPDEEIVVLERQLDELIRGLLREPDMFDVVIATGFGGEHLSTLAGEVGSSDSVTPGLAISEGLLIAHTQDLTGEQTEPSWSNPLGTLLSSCLLLEYIGWGDVVTVIQRAIYETLAAGVGPRGLYREDPPDNPASTEAFVGALIERVNARERTPGAGGRRTSQRERFEIRSLIVGIYNLLFDDQLSLRDIELNQLFDEDEEADIYLPEVGINFYYWRRWTNERRLEVLLHELAHVKQSGGERDHGQEFYDRLVAVTNLAADRKSGFEILFGDSIDFERVRELVVESVHEETIEPDLERVEDRKRILRTQFDIPDV